MRHIPVQFLRILLAVLAVVFANVLGRVLARLQRYQLPYSRAISWILRTAVCLFGVFWARHFDITSIVTLALAILALALGVFSERHAKKPDETHLFQDQ